MIEAPEARCLAEQINHTLKGKQITLVVTDHTPHKFTFYSGDTSKYESRLLNKTISEANARGGMLEVRVEDSLLIFTDGVTIRYYEPGKKLPPKYQMLVGFDDESCIIVSIRMYGGIWCIPVDWRNDPSPYFKGSLNEYYEIALTKPQALSDSFSHTYFMGLIEAGEMQNKSAKAFLATDQTIPGLGNGVLQNILYQAKIHPKKKIKDLTGKEKRTLFQAIKNTLQEIYLKKGRNTESDLFGNKGEYIPWLSKDTAGQTCTRCDEIIQKENYLGGSIYYCPGCQKL